MVTKRTVAARRPARIVSSIPTARKSPGARDDFSASAKTVSVGTASLTVKSTLEKLEEDRPVLFISLHRVLVRVATANASDYKSSANTLLTLIENERDFPTWYRHKPCRPKSKGEADVTLGRLDGKRLLEHAASSGEPVEYVPSFAYGHDFFQAAIPPSPIYSFIRDANAILGFQIDDIETFLALHGLRGFHAVGAAVPVGAIAPDATGPEVAAPVWWKELHDLEELRQLAGERLKAARKKTSNIQIAKEVASTINATEKSRGRDRKIHWDTVRGSLSGWMFGR